MPSHLFHVSLKYRAIPRHNSILVQKRTTGVLFPASQLAGDLGWVKLANGILEMNQSLAEPNRQRVLAAALAACGLATLVLLAKHPAANAKTFADVLQGEARDQLVAGIVHGGFIATLSVLLICFVYLSRYLGQDRVPVVVGLVAFCIATGAMMASMIVDGFVVPAIAVKFLDVSAPGDLASARTLFSLCGTLIRFLMPMAMIFQAIAMLGISLALLGQSGMARGAAIYGICVGLLLGGAILLAPAPMLEHLLLLGIVLQAFWYFAIAAAIILTPMRARPARL
jgi:hypothetical protein